MRQFLFIPCLFAVSLLLAQSKTPPYNQYQNAPAAQKPKAADCYVRKFDAGTSAFRRGDYSAALRLFQEAKTCPEALGSSRRMKELETRIEYCNEKLGRVKAEIAQKSGSGRSIQSIETTGRKFNISAALTRNTDPNCFQLTVKEADRAFRDSCWDDAAKLYRAAKNCADANQTDRERMSTRIESCRAAAEDELLQKEQKAVRTARHAIAANLADDALDLLRQGDRSLAWRLADFANFYVAPDDNPDCLEAMFGAYYYESPLQEKVNIRPPFCYQLSEDLGEHVQMKFSKGKSGERLTAFIPNESKMMSWELPSMKSVEPFNPAPGTATGFDVLPDGSLLYYDYNYFYLPNGQVIGVQSAESSRHCFSEDGEIFYYEDLSASVIRSINIGQGGRVQQQRKGANNLSRISAQPTAIPVTSPLYDMKAYHGELWLGYANRVEVLSRDKASGAMTTRMTWQLADSTVINAGIISMNLLPASREALVWTDGSEYYYFLHLAQDDSKEVFVVATHKTDAQMVATTSGADTLLSVSIATVPDSYEEIMTVHVPADNNVASRFYTRTGLYATVFTAISDDGHWIACHDARGVTRLWSMKDTCVNPPAFFENGYENRYSPDGNRLFSKTMSGLNVYDADDMSGGAQQVIPTLADITFLPEGVSNKWAVFFSGQKEISLQDLSTKRQIKCPVNELDGRRVPYAFDDTETRYFAYSPGNGVVLVKSLTDQLTMSSRYFGGEITLIRSIPGSDKLLVITQFKDINENRYTVKVWDLAKPTEIPKVLRLQGYNVQHARVSEQGDRIALSNFSDIRIFSLDNLDNETVVIKPPKNAYINDIAFRPDGLAVVSGDQDGNVNIWDVLTGKPLLHFSNVWAGQKYRVDRLTYAYGGTKLRLFSPGRIFTVNLDAYTLRDVVESNQRWLSSFSPEQIRDYNLEIAFKYPGNFDRLAESGDFPLIRSFFQYFKEQSISSNNIDQVRTYCERAYTLYQLLDAKGQKNLDQTMLEMYENYILKLLLRNNPEEASRVVAHLEKHFKRPNVAILSAAHCSLVRHDLSAASRLYTDYLLRLPNDGIFTYHLDQINTKLSQFQEYDLLDSAQITCLCEVFQQFDNFENLCPASKKYTTSPYSAQVGIYQDIYHALDSVVYSYNKVQKVKTLENALTLAATLDYPNAGVEEHPIEALVIALSEAYVGQAEFEQNSPKTPVLYKKAIDLLEKYGSSHSKEFVGSRLDRLAETQFYWGKYLSENDKPLEAIVHFNAALQTAKKLNTMLGAETEEEIRPELLDLNPLYLELGKARLLEGKPVEARTAFEQADQYLNAGSGTFWLGHVALLEKNETEAFLNFGSLSNASELGEALNYIQRMADLLPAYRTQLMTFIPQLKKGFIDNHPSVTVTEADYYLATFKFSHFAVKTQWDSTFVWSSRALKNATTLMMATTPPSDQWQNVWIELSLNNTYHLLMAHHKDTASLSEVIRYSNEVLAFVTSNNQYYQYLNYFNTNLAHAYWLRNRPGDRALAINSYKSFLANQDYGENWETLLKDFRDLHRTGLQWPDLKNLMQQIKPENVVITPADWKEMEE